MGALVEHYFKKGFLLREEQLRKIHELVRKRIEPLNLQPEYRVKRADAYSYTTKNIEEILREENEDWKKIVRLEVFAESPQDSGQSFALSLKFVSVNTGADRYSFYDPIKGLSVFIEGDDRDAVYLLFSDLGEYLKNEVLSSHLWDKHVFRFVGMFFSILMMVGAFWLLTTKLDNSKGVDSVIESKDVAEKLNFLVRSRDMANRNTPWAFMLLALLAFPLLGTTNAVYNTVHFLFPTNLFVLGKQKIGFEKRKKLLSNLVWVVGVGAAVSVVTGLIVWKITA